MQQSFLKFGDTAFFSNIIFNWFCPIYSPNNCNKNEDAILNSSIVWPLSDKVHEFHRRYKIDEDTLT